MTDRRFTAVCLLAMFSIAAAHAHADSVCEKGYRDTTAAEQSTTTRALETAIAALPQAPTGWIIGGYEQISMRTSLCMDDETTPWHYNISRTYNRVDNVDEREAAQAAIGVQLRAAQAAKQPRIDALMTRIQSLGTELGQAVQRGDQARIDAINAESERLGKEFEAIMSGDDTQQYVDQLAVVAMQDVEMSIAVAVNPGSIYETEMIASAAPAGTQQAFRWQTTDSGVTNGHALILIGGWRPRPEGGIEHERRTGLAPAAVHAVSVRVKADPGRIDSLLNEIDFAAIAALIE